MISVMMPVYNGEQFLREAIDSVLAQTEENFELIIVNDGSTDSSDEIITSYNDSRINYIKQENGGEASARNTALRYAKGEFIVFQDADDVSLPNRFEKLRGNFFSEKIGVVHSDLLLINEKGEPISYYHTRNMEKESLLRFFLKIGTPFMIPSSMVRRELFQGFTYTPYKIGTDSDMIFQTTQSWESIHIPEPLLLYRRHENNVSNSSDYETLFRHARDFIDRHSLQELVPEINWNDKEEENDRAKAIVIVALFLFRRGMYLDGQEWYERALSLMTNKETQNFVQGLGHYILGEFQPALSLLQACEIKDHIIHNYLGEVCAALGDSNLAYMYFSQAMKLLPNYAEPMENIRSIGCSRNLHLVDTSMLKFSKA